MKTSKISFTDKFEAALLDGAEISMLLVSFMTENEEKINDDQYGRTRSICNYWTSLMLLSNSEMNECKRTPMTNLDHANPLISCS